MVVDTIAATGLVLTAVQALFAALQCKELQEMCSVLGYKFKLEELQNTVTTIKAVLLDVGSKRQELTHEGRVWVEKLKDAVYDADDLLDECKTLACQWKKKQGATFSKKVLQKFDQLFVAFNISQDIRKVRQKLDSIARDRSQFGFGDVYAPIERKRETSCSYVYENSIIGRGADKEAVISMLLQDSDSSSHHVKGSVSFVTIVGIGGLGKTALAQLVYNDDRVTGSFEQKWWVCVSEEFGMEEILGKMLTPDIQAKGGDVGELYRKVLKMIDGKKYLLVLDDVWEESHHKWIKLRDFLIRGARGSRVLVTSRSKEVARAIGSDPAYELQGLSDEYSWELFKAVAFEPGRSEEEEDPNLVDIGRKVVKQCANVPLSTRVIGSLLYGRDVSKWQSFESRDLSKLVQDTNDIMSILKFSYYHLSPQLKSCFSYCALFPRDWVIEKEVLMDLWLAQSCLSEDENGRSMEDIGEECFSMLLQRCFFQDVGRNEYGEISSCKMHDLIHDLAKEVAGKESLVMLDFDARQFDHKIRHLSVGDRYFISGNCLDNVETIRTLVQIDTPYSRFDDVNVGALLSRLRRVRVLDLSHRSFNTLPNAVGKLLQLRELDLSGCRNIKTLPKSITKLHNLLVLKLRGCTNLKELPKDLRELIHLRHLDTYDCISLTHMPVGMDSLSCLHKLSVFVVGGESSKQVQRGQLRDLKALNNLRGELMISVKDCSSYDETKFKDGLYLISKSHLKVLEIVWELEILKSDNRQVVHEAMLESLQPPSCIEGISLCSYEGVKLPDWTTSLSTALPCLVKISLVKFCSLQHLPSLSQLPHLKILQLDELSKVEYMEGRRGFSRALNSAFFPSLEELELKRMDDIKGWWGETAAKGESKALDFGCKEHEYEKAIIPFFPRLHKLTILSCDRMTLFPRCPLLKRLMVIGSNKRLSFYNSAIGGCRESSLEELTIDDAGLMSSLFGKSVRGVASVIIRHTEEESLISAAEGFQMQASSLVDLRFHFCSNLRSMKGGLEYLTNLQSLSLSTCDKLDMEDDEDGIPWKCLHSLSYLSLWGINKVEILPRGFQYLTSLETLDIGVWRKLRALPEWLSRLTSLRHLYINRCPELSSLPEAMRENTSLSTLRIISCQGLSVRCQEPDGEDFYKICHIPDLYIYT